MRRNSSFSGVIILLPDDNHWRQMPLLLEQAQAQQQFLTYNNTRYGYTIQYPSNWILDRTYEENGVRGVSFKPEGYRANITIIVTNFWGNDLEQAKTEMQRIMREINQPSTFTNWTRKSLSGFPAYNATAQSEETGRAVYIFTINKGETYQIEYFTARTSDERATKAIAQEMINSFQITGIDDHY
jgi:PsbP-like protein